MLKKFMQEKMPVIINCDTGIDDAVALIMAEKSGKLDIKLVCTDVGNIDTISSAKNCLDIFELIEANDIPVCCGDGKCLKRERPRVSVHGSTGLGNYEFHENTRKVCEKNAVDKMYEVLKSSEKKITIICLSPATNIAKLFIKYPDAKLYIERIVFMAGSIEELKKGEIPYAEFNVSCDPESAEIVLSSGVKIEIVPMEMGHTAYLDWEDVFKTKNLNMTGEVLEIIYRSYKDRHVKNGIATHDGCAICYVINPENFETKPANANIDYYDELDTGVLNINFSKNANVLVCTKINVKKFKKIYFSCLNKCK